MPFISRLWAQLALAAAGLLIASSAHAFCGFFAGKAGASLFNEASQVILARDGKRTVISMLNDFKGPLTDFALVVPVPQVLGKDQVRVGDKRLFDRLDAYSSPRLAEYFDPDPCPSGLRFNEALALRAAPAAMASADRQRKSERDQALGITVEASYTVGEYDIVMLSAQQSLGLETWLRENGYRMPPGAAVALKPYVAQDMKFFVAKVNLKEQAATGVQYLRPLQFAFESDKFMLPLRLGMINAAPDKAQDLIVYVLSQQGRVEAANYRTVKLPANQNLPPGIKRDFKGFYKALFDHQARQEEHRVVFTEYFWDMGWCDPCAADPLSPAELKQAGVFWLDEGVDSSGGTTPGNPGLQRPRRSPNPSGAQNAMLTRLHLRYTPQTFPEDLMLVQTRDRENWQTRYVVQNPFEGSLQQCQQKAGGRNCEAACNSAYAPRAADGGMQHGPWSQCIQSCQASQSAGLERARRYYEQELPQRRQNELNNLRRFTGWSLDEARRFSGLGAEASTGSPTPAEPALKWWQKLFGTTAAATPGVPASPGVAGPAGLPGSSASAGSSSAILAVSSVKPGSRP